MLEKIIVKQTNKKSILPKVIIGLIGMGLVALTIVWGLIPEQEESYLITISLFVAALGFGLATLLAWRKTGEYEIIEIKDNRIKLLSSKFNKPVFDAEITQTRFQKLRLPNGKEHLYLRDGTKAVEFANGLPQEEIDNVSIEMQKIIKMDTNADFSKGSIQG